MLDDVLAIPDHLRDALWRVESARLAPSESAGLLVCGMGGSAIGGDLAAAALGDRLTGPLLTVRGYELPSWATAEWTVLCSSYSGETEETLACFAAAEALGARRVVASTGGALVEAARAAGDPVIGLPGLLPRRAPRSPTCWSARSRSPPSAGSRRASPGRSRRRPPSSRPLARTFATSAAEIAATVGDRGAGRLRRRARPSPWPVAGRRRSTRTPSCRPSSPSCRRPTTTRSAAGRRRAPRGSRRSCSRTATSTRASGSASS